MDAFNFMNQEPEQELPASDEELIKLLGLTANGNAGNNDGTALADIVRNLELDIFNGSSTVVPTVAPMSSESIQGQFLVGHPGAQQLQTIAHVDLDSSETENTQYHLSGGFMINNEANVLPTTTQEVSSTAPLSPVAPIQDTREAAGGKAKGRRREQKVKLYQKTEPLASPEEEKRRQNAINAKMNREKKKNEMQELMNQAESLTAQNTQLKTENTHLTNKLQLIESQLKALCKQFNVPLVILPQ